MTEVDFYVLQAHQSSDRTDFACRLVDKAFRRGQQIYLHTQDESAAKALSQQLWSFRPNSFLPHGLLGEDDSTRITIGWGEDPGEQHDLMINLDLSVPAFVGRFQRVVEVVVQEPAIRDPLRESWKHYKHYGYPVNKHNL
jgi:DNA polymerase-3 subunit chi